MYSTEHRGNSNRADLAEVKRAAGGRWLEILASVAGLPRDILDGRNHPCPKCGGADRFGVDVGKILKWINALKTAVAKVRQTLQTTLEIPELDTRRGKDGKTRDTEAIFTKE